MRFFGIFKNADITQHGASLTSATRIYSVGNSSGKERSAAAFEATQATAGATNTFRAIFDSAEWVGQTVALRAAGRIVVAKVTEPEDSDQEFDFELSSPNEFGEEFTLADGEKHDTGFTLSAGTYTLLEDLPDGWELTEIICNNEAEVTVDLDNWQVIISLAAGETVECTFINTKTPSEANVWARISGARPSLVQV